MRRIAPLLGVALLLAGCGGGRTVEPTAEEVVGSVPTTTQAAAPPGNATAGEALFKAQGCGGCHTFTPAGTNGTIGPDLDKLPQYAKQANQGSLTDFIHESIQSPSSYVQPGFSPTMPDYGQSLSAQQISDLTAYLSKQG